MDKLLVIKIGGNVINNEGKLSSFLKAFATIEGKKILVHGGGTLATHLAGQLGITQQVIEGRRITNGETLKIVTMVYAGYINKNIVAQLQSHNCNAIGVSGADANSILAHKRIHPLVDYGFAGDVDVVNFQFLQLLLSNNLTPVLSPITHDKKGQLLNTNADTIAQEIAKAASKNYQTELIYSFEKSGVLLDINNQHSVIRKMDRSYYEELKSKGMIFAGMIPKLDNAFTAIDAGVKKVIIGKSEDITELIKGEKGTVISNG